MDCGDFDFIDIIFLGAFIGVLWYVGTDVKRPPTFAEQNYPVWHLG